MVIHKKPVETSMYYCKTRYYVPEWCRWLNGDSIEYLKADNVNGMNLFSYCQNNPVTYVYEKGTWGFAALFTISLLSGIIGGAMQLISNAASGKTGSELWRGVAGAAVGTATNALLLCVTGSAGLVASSIISGGTSAFIQSNVNMLENIIRGEEVTAQTYWSDWAQNAFSSITGNIIGGKLVPINSGWFQPKYALSVVLKKYGQRIITQTLIGSSISGSINFIKNTIENILKKY